MIDFCVVQDFPILCQTCLGDNPYIRMVSDISAFGNKLCLCVCIIYRISSYWHVCHSWLSLSESILVCTAVLELQEYPNLQVTTGELYRKMCCVIVCDASSVQIHHIVPPHN